MTGTRRRAALTVATFSCLGIVFVQAAVPGEPPRARLPDIRAVAPSAAEIVKAERGRWVLAFPSVSENVGDGPLIIDASRPNRRRRKMTATQVLERTDGSTRRHPRVGKLRFERSVDHSHWHYLRFMVYELRTPDGKLVAPDVKTGFCLGDRGRITDQNIKGAAREPRFVTNCGKARPRLLRLREGISVGWHDDYKAFLEGQYVDVTDVPAGRYTLVHRANPRKKIRETTYTNNASSALIELTRREGKPPSVEILERCDDTPRCG